MEDRFGSHLGPILGPSWGDLGPSWSYLGPSWAHLGPILSHLRVILGHLGPILVLSWAYLGLFGAMLCTSWATVQLRLFFSPKVKTIRSCAPGPSASFLNLGLCCRYPWAVSLTRPRSPDSSASRSAGCFRFPLVLLSLLL